MQDSEGSTTAQWARDAEINLTTDDKFEVSPLADRLVDLLSEVKPPFTLSLSGSWGVGKSTVARAIVDRLRNHKVRAQLIDAWTLDVGALRRRVVVEVGAALAAPGDQGHIPADAWNREQDKIAKRLDEARATQTDVQAARIELRDRASFRKASRDHGTTLLAAIDIFALAALLTVLVGKDSGLQPVFAGLSATLLVLLVTGSVFKVVTPSVSRMPAKEELQLAATFERIVTGKDEEGQTVARYARSVVVVLDNLDRLSGDDALRALAEIRSFVEIDGSRCVFVIPIDRRRLAEHLGRNLHDTGAASDYLEKFFNLDLALVQPEPVDLHSWALEQAKRLFKGEDEEQIREASEVVVSAARRSPRAITRIFNGLVTRYRATRGLKPKVGLPSLALVEGLLSIAPGLADQLALSPRVLTDGRDSLAGLGSEIEQIEALNELMEPMQSGDQAEQRQADQTHQRIRVFLWDNRHIPLERQQLRLALALRTDRLWGGIPDPDALEEALASGDKAAFDRALEGRDKKEIHLIFERAVAFIERNAGSSRLVSHAVEAAGEGLVRDKSLYAKAYPTAVRAISKADPSLVTTLNRPAIQFLFQGPAIANLTEARQLLLATVWNAGDEPIAPLVWGVRLFADQLISEQLGNVQKALARQDDDDLAPLFENPPALTLIDGEVARAILQVLGTWSPETGPHERVIRLATWLIDASRAGWRDDDGLRALAAASEPKVVALVPEPASLQALDTICRLIGTSTAPAAEIDQFGGALAARQEVGESDLFRPALLLPVRPGPLASGIGSQIGIWMATASAERIKILLDATRSRVEEALPDYRDRLLNLWDSKADPTFARLAVAGEDTQLPRLRLRWGETQGHVALARAVEAFEIIAEVRDKAAMDDFVAEVAGRIRSTSPATSIPPSAWDSLAALLQALRKQTVARAPIIGAVEERVQNLPDATEVQQAFPAVSRAADEADGAQRRRLADALMERLVRWRVVEPESSAWVVQSASPTQLMNPLVALLVGSGLIIEPTLAVVDAARARGVDSAEVFAALLTRAAAETAEANAERDLKAANAWSRPPADDAASALADLQAVEDRYPALKKLVAKLRKSLPKP